MIQSQSMGEKRDVKHFLDDIIESIEKINSYSKDITEEEFLTNIEKQDAITRRIEIIGAVKNIPDEIRFHFPEIQWKKIAGLRDVSIYNYFGVIPKRLWKIIRQDLPLLNEKIIKVRSSLTD